MNRHLLFPILLAVAGVVVTLLLLGCSVPLECAGETRQTAQGPSCAGDPFETGEVVEFN